MSEIQNRAARIFDGALSRQEADRPAYVIEMCGSDQDLLREVESLLAYDVKASNFLGQPASHQRPFKASELATQKFEPQAALEQVGPYRIKSLLGMGGMGQVYLAEDTRLGRPVALKMLHSEMTHQADARARFLREARSAAALQHPNIAAVFDAGEIEGLLFLAMEYVPGKPLRSILQQSGLPEQQVLDLALQLASALEHAHGRGILHRDIKPENIIIDSSQTAKLVDFGIAKALDAQGAAEITTPGMFVGTLKYISPEILSGQAASRRSDLYSLGITLFEACCCRTPFDGLPPMGLVGAILQGEPIRLQHYNAAASDGFAQVVDQLLARNPEERTSGATDLLNALRAVRENNGVSKTRSPGQDRPGVVVLEFSNLSKEFSTDWLGVGIAEAIESEFRNVSELSLVGRTRAQQVIRGMQLNLDDAESLARLGRQLGSKWVVTGSFQRSGHRIRVTSNVLNVMSGESISAGKIDGNWDDLFEVQDRVTRALLDLLGAKTSELSAPAPATSLDVYEHYARGRQLLMSMGAEALTSAKKHFTQAISLDPTHALSHAGLGSAHALTFIQSSNPQDLMQARPFLERAVELDSELGEPYQWLSLLYLRLGDVEKALTCGERGVKLQPHQAQAHYFYGLVLLTSVEVGKGSLQRAAESLMQTLNLEPRMAPAWMLLAWTMLESGNYLVAKRILDTAWQLEKVPNLPARFVGARTILGLVHARQRQWDPARSYHQESIEWLRDTQHVYRSVYTTHSACSLGEIELRTGNPELAMDNFRNAWRITKEEPRMNGNVRLGIQIQAGMAAAYSILGERERAEQHLAEGIAKIKNLDISSALPGLLLPDIHYAVAVAQHHLGMADEAFASLRRALDTGWSDADWFRNDPVWQSIQNHEDYRHLLERLSQIPPVLIDVARIPVPHMPTSSSKNAPPM